MFNGVFRFCRIDGLENIVSKGRIVQCTYIWIANSGSVIMIGDIGASYFKHGFYGRELVTNLRIKCIEGRCKACNKVCLGYIGILVPVLQGETYPVFVQEATI